MVRQERKDTKITWLCVSFMAAVATCTAVVFPAHANDAVSNEVHHRHKYWNYQLEKHWKNKLNFTIKDVQLGCKELRSKKYISDGYCTSVKPILEVVCSGVCLPVADLPWYSELIASKSYRDIAWQWRCVNGRSTKERVHLICKDGTERSYKIRLVKSCKCKRNQVRKHHYDHTL